MRHSFLIILMVCSLRFLFSQEIVKTRRLKLRSVLDALNMRYRAATKKAGNDLPNLHITCK